MDSIYSALIPTAASKIRSEIAQVLKSFGKPIVTRVAKSGALIRPLRPRERYADASPVLCHLGIDVDAWPAPPAGLFVVEERTVYLRSRSPMTIAHEFGHAIDCALGGGVYLSGTNPEIRRAFIEARSFVTPYAASGRRVFRRVRSRIRRSERSVVFVAACVEGAPASRRCGDVQHRGVVAELRDISRAVLT